MPSISAWNGFIISSLEAKNRCFSFMSLLLCFCGVYGPGPTTCLKHGILVVLSHCKITSVDSRPIGPRWVRYDTCSHGRTVRRTVRVVVRVSVRVSVVRSVVVSVGQFLGRNPDPTSNRPTDGPDFCPTTCPTFSRRGYCRNNDHVSLLEGRRHGLKSAVANFRTAELGQRTCCCTVLHSVLTLLLIYFIKIMLWSNA
jgi:hypothetical protein